MWTRIEMMPLSWLKLVDPVSLAILTNCCVPADCLSDFKRLCLPSHYWTVGEDVVRWFTVVTDCMTLSRTNADTLIQEHGFPRGVSHSYSPITNDHHDSEQTKTFDPLNPVHIPAQVTVHIPTFFEWNVTLYVYIKVYAIQYNTMQTVG